MSRRTGRIIGFAAVLFVTTAYSSGLQAEEGPVTGGAPSAEVAAEAKPAALEAGPFLEPLGQELGLMGTRLRRGAANAGLGWLEVPAGIQEIGDKHGVGAAATWGVLHGSGRAVQRTAVGLFEILTFPFKLTDNNKPMIEPEFVLDKPQASEPAES